MRAKTFLLLGALVALHLILLFAGFIAPYDPAAQDRDLPYAQPTPLHVRDAYGWHLRPFVYAQTIAQDGYVEDTSRSFPVHIFVELRAIILLWEFFRLTGIYSEWKNPGKSCYSAEMASAGMNSRACFTAARFRSPPESQQL